MTIENQISASFAILAEFSGSPLDLYNYLGTRIN
jgi:hypothetical protein